MIDGGAPEASPVLTGFIKETLLSGFVERVKLMNARYHLPVARLPTTFAIGEPVSERLTKLKKTLQAELDEIDDIIAVAKVVETEGRNLHDDELTMLVAIADLMVDLQVYTTSELVKFGIDPLAVQAIVMDSNDSKLGEDGLPIKNADGKFLKGPNYWKPEPLIRQLLKTQIDNWQRANT